MVMAETQSLETRNKSSKTLYTKSWSFAVLDSDKDPKMSVPPRNKDCINHNEDVDSPLCVSGSRLIGSGFTNTSCTDNLVLFLNAGDGASKKGGNFGFSVQGDNYFGGGNIFRTNETIIDGGDFPPLYQSARIGNFCYQFDNLSPGDYNVDLHFAEIVNTNGPKGLRVFDVYMQEEKVVSKLDIFSIVGANKPLQLVDVRVSVGEDESIVIRFEGVHGSPIVNAICIRRAAKLPESQEEHQYLVCNNCAAEVKITSAQYKYIRMQYLAKYEKEIEELRTQCQLKADECYEAWMSLTTANEQLENLRMELDNKCFQNHCLDQAVEKQAAKLREVSSRYEHDKRLCIAAIDELDRKLKIMKREHSQLSREAHDCADSVPELNKMVFAVQELVSKCDDLKLKFNEEQAKRKKLYNQVQESKGNIRVFCRCRPLSKDEAFASHKMVVDFDAAKDGELGILTGGSTKKLFKFDRVYTPKDDQGDVFMDASPMVISVLDGYNVSIFAYGQTGTGKTFTMEGTEQHRGVNYRTLEQLFQISEERKDTVIYNISVSVLEVYNEQIRDLLVTSPAPKKLEIRQTSEGVHHVPGIIEAKVENIKEAWDVLRAGNSARAVGSNNVNEHSSRSHCTLCVTVRAMNLISGECTKSKLWLVDLAGSERLAKTEVQGERLKEAQNINKSLAAVGDVIFALAAKSSHVPYRNSKLTHLLQDSLGGDSKTLMFVQISPSEQDLGETISSLNFATRVQGVELGPAKKQIDTAELQKLKMMLDKAKQEMRFKDDALRKIEENFNSLEGKAKGKDQICRNQQEKVNELEGQLASQMELCSQLEIQLLQLSEQVQGKDEFCFNLQQKVKELESKFKENAHAESMTLQHKVKVLESNLKERTEEFELHSWTLRQKVKELENKLTMEGDNQDSQLLEQKIKELEGKLRLQEQRRAPPLCSTEKSRATPNGRKLWSRAESVKDTNSPILRSLDSSTRSVSQGSSVLLKGTDSLRELRRKRVLQSKGTDNNFLLSASLVEKRISSSESNEAKHIDQSRALARITRSTKTSAKAPTAFSNNKILRDQVSGARESNNNKSKVWLR